MGGIAKQIGGQQPDAIGQLIQSTLHSVTVESQVEQLTKQVAHLTKLVHILWKAAEKMEKVIQLTPDGLQIKSGVSEVLVLKNGGIILDGQRILLKTPGKDQLMF